MIIINELYEPGNIILSIQKHPGLRILFTCQLVNDVGTPDPFHVIADLLHESSQPLPERLILDTENDRNGMVEVG